MTISWPLAGRWLATALLALSLGACSGKPQATAPAFHATDITGVPWGKDFQLQDTSGKTRSLADFRGKVVAVFFGYLHCPDFCPATLAKMNQVVQALGPQGRAVQVLFVTVDPARDTPDKLAPYVASFNPAFLGLSGTPAQLEKTARDFKIFYEKRPSRDGKGYEMDHSANLYILDPQGRPRLSVAPDETVTDIVRDLRQLLPAA